MKFERYKHIFAIAFEAVLDNKFRSILTALGIIFGVAAVIAMMAIGNGAKQEILDQMKMVGVNNIIITPLSEIDKEDESEDENELEKESKRFSPGLSLKDAESIKKIIPSVVSISPEISSTTRTTYNNKQIQSNLSGISADYFDMFNLKLEEGHFFIPLHFIKASPVCIIGNRIKSKLFPYENPVGKLIKCNDVWLRVIGVLESKPIDVSNNNSLGVSNTNDIIFIPLQTSLSRFNNPSIVNAYEMYYAAFMYEISMRGGGGSKTNHQLNKIIVQVDDNRNLSETAEVIEKILKRKHNEVVDFEVKVPELLLKQEQRTKDIFNIVLAAIASISLIVGGIGIMNIMLASILERIREIGLRLAIGAHKRDVILQFLTESTLISLTGGILGILLGVILAKLIMQLTDILTIISPLSILVSFGVSATVGIIFGFMPARKAANQDPVTSLRHD